MRIQESADYECPLLRLGGNHVYIPGSDPNTATTIGWSQSLTFGWSICCHFFVAIRHSRLSVRRYSSRCMPLHFGYFVHPQNSFPVCLPRCAMRFVMLPPHTGHAGGISISSEPNCMSLTTVFLRAVSIIIRSLRPSTSSRFSPWANASAASV